MTYELVVHKDGRFEINNSRRDKIVFQGSDDRIKTKAGDTYKYDSVRDLLGEICGWVSMATFRRISKKLAAW